MPRSTLGEIVTGSQPGRRICRVQGGRAQPAQAVRSVRSWGSSVSVLSVRISADSYAGLGRLGHLPFLLKSSSDTALAGGAGNEAKKARSLGVLARSDGGSRARDCKAYRTVRLRGSVDAREP